MMSKAKKPSKPKTPNVDDIRFEVRYGVSIPETNLMELIRDGGCAGKLREMKKEIGEWIDELTVDETLVSDIGKAKNYEKVLTTVADVLDIIEGAWKSALCEYAESTGFSKKPEKAAKAKSTGGVLTKAEQAKVKALRKQGFSIKAIGKTIHRAEKAVADFVKSIDKKRK